jgi:hypothetical protein
MFVVFPFCLMFPSVLWGRFMLCGLHMLACVTAVVNDLFDDVDGINVIHLDRAATPAKA